MNGRLCSARSVDIFAAIWAVSFADDADRAADFIDRVRKRGLTEAALGAQHKRVDVRATGPSIAKQKPRSFD